MASSDEEVFEFLSRPEAFGGQPVERLETHTSAVFLAGDRAYKLKKPVRYSYLDYSTPELRRIQCEAEIAVNRPLAPSLYLGLTPVTRGTAGALAVGGAGAPVDWLVVMRRFAQQDQFDRMAERGALTPALMRLLADEIADIHARAAVKPGQGGIAGLRQAIDITVENLRIAARTALAPQAAERWIAAALAALDRLAPLLERRRREGHVRACHGDLHLGNICLYQGAPTLFDAIEFDPSLSAIDVLYDLAFLLMDLHHRRLDDFASLVFNRYLDRGDEADGLAALPLFQSTRAAIRAQIAVATLTHGHDASARAPLVELAHSYLELALDLLAPPAPRLIAIGGVSGGGKTTVAHLLAPSIGAAPGARVLRTDVLRKRIAGVGPETALPADAYTPESHRATYARLCDEARRCLEAGHSVIADAVFGLDSERAAIAEIARAARVPFAGLWLEAPPDALLARVASRAGDASDATADVVRAQLAHVVAPRNWARIDAAAAIAEVAATARAALRSREDPGH